MKNKQAFLEGASTRDYMQLYNNNNSTLDTWIMHQYGSWVLPYRYPDVNDAIIDYRIKMLGSFILNDYYFSELYKTLSYDYNPISNYDRHEEWTDTRTPNLTTKDDGEYKNQPYSDTDSIKHDVYPYDGDTAVPQGIDVSTKQAGLQTGTNGNTRVETGTDVNKHEGKTSGNIGVTTTQDMIASQRDIVDIAFIKTVIRRLIEECFICQTIAL